MPSSQWRVRSQVQLGICWALGLLARCIDHSLSWQSYLSEESLTWGKSLKRFLKRNVTPAWGHRQADVIAMLEPGVVPQWDTETQKHRGDAGTLWETGEEEEEEEVCRSCSFQGVSLITAVCVGSDHDFLWHDLNTRFSAGEGREKGGMMRPFNTGLGNQRHLKYCTLGVRIMSMCFTNVPRPLRSQVLWQHRNTAEFLPVSSRLPLGHLWNPLPRLFWQPLFSLSIQSVSSPLCTNSHLSKCKLGFSLLVTAFVGTRKPLPPASPLKRPLRLYRAHCRIQDSPCFKTANLIKFICKLLPYHTR